MDATIADSKFLVSGESSELPMYESMVLKSPEHRYSRCRRAAVSICFVTASVVTPLLQLSYLRCCNCRNSVAPIAVTLLRF